MIFLHGSGLANVIHVMKNFTPRPKRSILRTGYIIQEMSVLVDTEQTFDQEFNVVDATKVIVDKAKAEVKSKYGNKKRHRQ